jgi:hypothetical protein
MSDLSVSFDSGIPLPIDLSPDELTTTLKRAKVYLDWAIQEHIKG